MKTILFSRCEKRVCSGFLRGQVLQSSFNFLWKQGLFCGLCEDLFFQILQDYFGSLSTALVKDCEVKTFPFIPAASSLWQFPSWWVCRQAWRVPRELCWLLHSNISSSMEEPTLTVPWIGVCSGCSYTSVMFWPCTRQLGHTEQWQWSCECAPGGLMLVLCVCEAPWMEDY